MADAYGSPEVDIEGILGAEISPDDPDRAVIEPWAAAVDGPILDVGAGTGRLGDGGSLLMSFFAGPRREAFDHPIAAAYRWPMNKMVEALTHAGFEVIGQRSNPRTPHAYITARATPGFS
ncbi:hypothetical protein [Nesterenkonia massiliensis]|uniref:hypothetical protein n=1 Tax=Nesterenkonia massiliensis TaxID=1232429 RepID=UPI000409887A|nr:hypothetical protein [Nesterenkonia massiliensis]